MSQQKVLYKKTVKRSKAASVKRPVIRFDWKTVVKYAVVFALMAVLNLGRIADVLRPFAFGLFMALIFSGFSIIVTTPVYMAASLLAAPEVNTLIVVLPLSITLVAAELCHRKAKKKMSLPLLFLYGAIGQAGYVYISVITNTNLLAALLTLTFGFVFMYACVAVLNSVIVRKMKYKLNKSELGCLGIVIIAVFCGLASIPAPVGDIVVRAAAALIGLAVLYAFGGAYCTGFMTVCGLGAALAFGDIAYIAGFALAGLTAGLFCDLSRVFSAASIVMTDIIIGLYFNAYISYTYLSVLALALGGILFACIPGKTVNRFGELTAAGSYYAPRHIVNRTREQLYRRLSEVSRVFGDMDMIFTAMSGDGMSADAARAKFIKELPPNLCEGCANRSQCFRALGEDTYNAFGAVLAAGFNKGKVTLMDIPPFITSRCGRVNMLINIVNSISEKYTANLKMQSNAESSRRMLAEQLGGVSRMLGRLAEETRVGIAFDRENERRLMEEFTYSDIMCREVIISGEGMDSSVNLVMLENTYTAEKMLAAVRRVLRQPYVVISDEQASAAGNRVLLLKAAPVYDVVYGAANAVKLGGELSGDVHTFLKINDDRFLMAICDGMGAGRRAERMATSALALLESFYKAEFDNDTIISGVNKLLTLSGEEIFAAMDVAVINLRTGQADFIKIGAPEGVLKRRDGAELLEASSLPIGVLDELRPMIRTKNLAAGDMIVLASDGILDAIGGGEGLADCVNGMHTVNPQELASDILDRAMRIDKLAPHDDMTVITARIFPYK
ncbi:MAG: SpoIIE family protein phosphatase [Clostridiales bacterium]|nr:SpoIIE family protein phosphatase [Clostridiales bacterium]